MNIKNSENKENKITDKENYPYHSPYFEIQNKQLSDIIFQEKLREILTPEEYYSFFYGKFINSNK